MKLENTYSKFILAILLLFFVSKITKAQVDSSSYLLKQVQVSVGQKSISSCSNKSLTITGTTASNYSSILWTKIGGSGFFDQPTALNPTYTLGYDESISGKVLLVVKANGIDGCSSYSDTITVTVNSVFFTINDSDFTACQNVSTHLIAKVSKGAGGYSYEWSPSTYLDKTTGNDVLFTPTSSSTISYHCTVTDALGCKGYNQIQITTKPIPTVNITSNPTPKCPGDSLLLSVNGTYSSYLWDNGAKTATTFVYPKMNVPNSVTVTDAIGCSASTQFQAPLLPTPIMSINQPSQTICLGNTLTLQASQAFNYAWSNGESQPSITVSPLSSTTYTVTGSSVNGCYTTASVTIGVSPQPVVSISSSSDSICTGNTIKLSVTGISFLNYKWSSGQTDSIFNVSPITSTLYTVTATNSFGCTSFTSKKINVLNTIDVLANPSTIQIGQSSELTAIGVSSCSWSNMVSTQPNVTVSPQTTTNYTVSSTNYLGCAVTGSVTVVVNGIATNKVALLKTLKEADSLRLKAPIGLSPGKYPPIAFENLTKETQKAQSVYSDTKASQAHIDSTVQKLSNAIVLFKAAIIYIPSVAVKSINIFEGNQTVLVNKSFSLHAQIYPSNASNQQINWYFKNANNPLDKGYLGNGSIVTLTPPQIGNYILYAYSNEYYILGKDTIFHHDSVNVTVSLPIPVTKITVNTNELKIAVGASDNSIIATLWPLTANNKNLIWSSKDGTIANVDPSTGTIIGIAEGTTTITVASIENPILMQNVAVYVYNVTVDKSKLENTLSEADFVISNIIESTDIGTSVGQYDKTAWDALNKMYGLAKDELYSQTSTQITVNTTVIDLLKAIASFKNSKVGATLVSSLTIKPGNVTLSISSAPYQLSAIVLPSDASNKSLVWESSDETVVTVDKNGLVTVVGGGSATIKATTTDGSSISENSTITVIVPVKSISLPQVVGLQVDTKFIFTALVLPSNATYKDLVWSSSDKTIASVDNNGVVLALKPGSAKIIAQSTDGQVTAMTIVNVSLEAIPLKSITLPDTLHLLLGETQTLNAIIQPYNATNTIVNWTSSNASSLSIDYKGEIIASGIDTVVVYAYSSDDEKIFDSTIVYINASKAPEVLPIKPITIQEGTASISIPLSSLVVDDKTSLSNLVFVPNQSNNFTIQIIDDSLIITPIDPKVIVKENISISVVDQDGQSVSVTIPVSISSGSNKAAIISEMPKQAIIVGGSFIPVSLPLYVTDDYTKQEDIVWTVSSNPLFKASVNFNTLYVEPVSSTWIGIDSLLLTAKDKDGATSSKYIQYSISNKANEAPVLTQIPVQEQTNTTAFQPIVLSKYVTDDYTPTSSITWTVSKSNKVSITIVGGKAFVTVIDKNWTGSDLIVFTATDQGGLSNTVNVFLNQKATVSQITWAGKPEVSFTAERTKVGSKELVKFHGSITGQASDGSEWTFDGGSPAQSYDLNPTVSYEKPGKFDVLFVASNNGEIDSSLMADYITVVGITTPDTVLCPGKSAVLSVSDKSLTKYQWSNGDNTASITVSPSVDTKYSVTVQSGLVKYYDTVLVSVSKPVSLGNDTAICEGSTLTYTLQGFTSYKWNNITSFNKNTFKTSTAQNISVEVKDAYGCVSSAGVEVSVNALPTVNLGVDDSICPSIKKQLDAGTGFSAYKWNDGITTSQIKEVSATGKYIVTVTDANGCKNSDTISIVVKKPYAEPLGVASFSENGSKIVLAWERTKKMNTVKYEIYREVSQDVYTVIDTVPFDSTSIVVDKNAIATQQAYKYKLRTYDVCGSFAESEPHRTMFMTTNYNSQTQKINIEWNRYEGLPLTKYNVYEINKSNGDSANIGTVPASTGVSTFNFTVNKPKAGYQYRVGYSIPSFDPKITKSDNGPFSQSLSNMAESELVGVDVEEETLISVYPNPAQTHISISTNGFEMDEIEILDVLGNCVYKSNRFEHKNTVDISIEEFTSGIYTARIKTIDSVKTTMFIKD